MKGVTDTVQSQYANSPTLMQLITNMNGYIDPAANINQFYSMIWNVLSAQGYGLDVWGRIVGVSRILQVATSDYFGFSGPDGASGLPASQAPFYNSGSLTSNYSLLDEPYRTLILAKAMANICNATIPAINQILINLFGAAGPLPIAGNSYCTDGEDQTMTYTFSSGLSPLQAAIIYQSGVLPRPAGVSATVVHP
jgi:hypothetical protein